MPASAGMTMRLVGAKRKKPITRVGADRFSKNRVSANAGELFALSISSQISRNPTVVAPSESPVSGVPHVSPTHRLDDHHCIHNGLDVGAAGSAGPRWPREFCLW